MARPITWEGKLKEKAIDLVLETIEQGSSLRSILDNNRDKDVLPSRRVFNEWLRDDDGLSTQYAYACEKRADAIFEDILAIADDTTRDKKTSKDGEDITDNEVIQRSRLRVDARKWMLSKMNPKKYGDKIDMTTGGDKIQQPILNIDPLDNEE
jgi:hypothetical protein